jgi:radical SAM protein with 4Fe4S-binding SPASM domain
VRRRTGGRRVPLGGAIALTRRCNHRCRQCYNNLPAADESARAAELGTAEVMRLLDEIAAAGCVWLLFTGGEIFLRPDLLEIYDHARRQGLLVTLFTNGTLITPQAAAHLSRSRPFAIEVTLYGATPETYERVTGVPGSCDRCRRGIALLREHGLPLKLKSTVSNLNRHELPQMRQMAAELGLEFRFDAVLNPRCDGRPGALDVRLSPAEVVALDLAEPERVSALREFAEQTNREAVPAAHSAVLYRCGGGLFSFGIDPYGRMRPCLLSHEAGFDVRGGRFAEAWEVFMARLRGQLADRPTKCTDCRMKAFCGMCPANAGLECGDPQQPVDFLCRVAHLRAYALDITFPPHGECEYCPGGAQYNQILMRAKEIKI